MDIELIYKKLLFHGNREIANLTTRCILADSQQGVLYLDKHRMTQELRLYRLYEDKGFQSILSALIPIIISNSEIENSFRQACELFYMIRKRIQIRNKLGINLLCHYLYQLEDFDQFFAEYTMIEGSKEEELAFQKEKIEIILKKKTVEQSIVDCLEEQSQEPNIALLESLRADEKPETDEVGSKMAAYLQKLKRFGIIPKPFVGEFLAEKLKREIGAQANDDLLGVYRVKEWDEGKKDLTIETKRGILRLRLATPSMRTMPSSNPSAVASTGITKEPIVSSDAPYAMEERAAAFSSGALSQQMMERFGVPQLDLKWQAIIRDEQSKDYFSSLLQRVDKIYHHKRVYPKQEQVFNALQKVPFDKVRVVIIGQDPYHGPNQANGLCFSVNPGVKAPPSLQNIFKELELEYGRLRTDVDLSDWAEQGVLLLNAVLTVEEGAAGSHSKQGWECFTDRIIAALSKREEPLVFILWGNYAAEKAKNVDARKHLILKSNHPSPLSAHRGFFGNKHFISANEFLRKNNLPEVDWI